MSTRANIILKDGDSKLTFYRHSDGYPEGAMPTLEKFIKMIKEGQIRNDLGQAAGWLILLGNEEYEFNGFANLLSGEYDSWKIGSIEPTTGIHGDIEYLYVVDLQELTIKVHETDFDAVA
jgi:hypothetical protein